MPVGIVGQVEEAAASVVAAEEREHCRQVIADAKEGSSVPKGACADSANWLQLPTRVDDLYSVFLMALQHFMVVVPVKSNSS